jgi:hypothetical protein
MIAVTAQELTLLLDRAKQKPKPTLTLLPPESRVAHQNIAQPPLMLACFTGKKICDPAVYSEPNKTDEPPKFK